MMTGVTESIHVYIHKHIHIYEYTYTYTKHNKIYTRVHVYKPKHSAFDAFTSNATHIQMQYLVTSATIRGLLVCPKRVVDFSNRIDAVAKSYGFEGGRTDRRTNPDEQHENSITITIVLCPWSMHDLYPYTMITGWPINIDY